MIRSTLNEWIPPGVQQSANKQPVNDQLTTNNDITRHKPMTLRTKLDKMENQLSNPNDNPLLAGTHEYHCVVNIGGTNPGTFEWIENVSTGARYEVTYEWRKALTEYYKYKQPGIDVVIGKRGEPDSRTTLGGPHGDQ